MQIQESHKSAGGVFTTYCPMHEYEHDDCDEFCLPRRKELWVIDAALRAHWWRLGYRFTDRGRSG